MTSERTKNALRAVMENHSHVSLNILTGPASPLLGMYSGQDTQQIVSNSIAAGIETWLTFQYLGQSASAVELSMARRLAIQAVAPSFIMGAGVAYGAFAATEVHKDSTTLDKASSVGGLATGSTKKQKIARLGGL